MYQIYHNGILFYDDNIIADEYKLTSAKLSLSAGSAGSLNIAVPLLNVMYDQFTKMVSYVDVYRNSDLIFSGRVIDETKDYQGVSKITCEGLLAVFNDTVFEPQVFASITLSDLITAIITNHNAKVGTDKQVQLGTITVTDDYVYRAYEDYALTIDRLKDLSDSYGGYMAIRKTNGVLYFDWIAEFTEVAEQSIDFGQNLINLTQDSSADELITVLLPLGAEIEDDQGNRSRLTVESVNAGSIYIENAEGIAEFGRITGIQTWDDVTIPSNLLAKGTEYLNDMKRSRVTISARAVDMAKAGSTVESFKVGQKINVSASLFGVNDQFVCLSQSLDLMNPVNNQMTLGNKVVGYVGKTQAEQSAVNKTISIINNNYTSGTQLNNAVNPITETVAELISSTTVLDTRIDEVAGSVTDAITTAEEYADGRIEEISSQFIRTDSEVIIGFTNTVDNVNSTFTFESDGLTIKNQNSRIYAKQGADYYKFVDGDTDTDVFRIDETGTTGLQANVTGQFGIGSGSVDAYAEQWAIRKGAYQTGIGYDLQIVWIGG